MPTNNRDSPLSHCQAAANDPKISVHQLSEFVYCRRAGLITREKPIEAQERDQIPGLAYRDNYEPWSIQELFDAQCEKIKAVFAFSMVPAVTAILCLTLNYSFLGLVLLVAALVIWWRARTYLASAMQCQKRLREIEQAKNLRIDLSSSRKQNVHWWELLKEFQLRRSERVYHDDHCQLCGSLQGVLLQGSLRIPVFWLRSLGNRQEFQDQHLVRMAAYCHLLQSCEGAESPFGVFVLPNSFHCVTIPNIASARLEMFRQLQSARNTIHSAEDCHDPSPPPPGRCRACPHGKPVPISRDTEDDISDAESIWVSDCGERFAWRPPYGDSARR